MMEFKAIYTEEELVLLLKEDSRAAFGYLYRQYAAALFGAILRVVSDEQTAEDVLQEAFIKIWSNIERYDPRKGRIYTWMLNIGRNAAIDKLRSRGELMKGKIQMGDEIVNNAGRSMKTEPATDMIGLRKAVSGLRPEYEIIINLAYFNGYTLDEISRTLDIPLGTVKTRMRSAIRQLREIFEA